MSASEQNQNQGLFSADTASAELRGRLAGMEAVRRADLEVTRQVARSGAWYVVHDLVTFSHHRMSVTDYQIFAEIRQGRTLADCFQRLVAVGVLQDADAERFYKWVVQLNRLGLISLPIDTGQILHQRAQEKKSSVRQSRLVGMLFYRLPLFSPDAFLRRTVNLVAPLFSRLAVVLWAVAMVLSSAYVWRHLEELADPFRYASAAQSAILMTLLLVVLKGIHEFGHAYACRYFGGSVPEMGVFFIVFTPCAYVNASSSWSFPQRHRRIAVALAGMYFESIAAMAALLLWSVSGPSLLKAAAHQALVLATVVTVGFNINPLMKFDGYYALADLLRIPDLRGDALYEWKRFLKKTLYGLATPSRATSTRASAGLTLFGCAASLYKVTVILGIGMLILGLPLIGPPLGAVFILSFAWQLIFQFIRYTVTSRELAPLRLRAAAVAVAGVAAAISIVTYLPSPRMTVAHGVARHEIRRTLHATDEGRLDVVAVQPGQSVQAGQQICRLTSPALHAESRRRNGSRITAELELQSSSQQHPSQYALAAAKYDQHRARSELVQADSQAMTIVAPVAGQVLSATVLQRPGSWVHKGDAVAVIGHGRPMVEAIVSEEETAGQLPLVGEHVEVRLETAEAPLLDGIIAEVSPGARNSIHESSLTSLSGGPVELHPQTGESELAWFTLRIVLQNDPQLEVFEGVRAVVKLNIDHPPIGVAIYQSCCRLRDSFMVTR